MNLDNLRQAMQDKNISISELAKKANIGQATVSELLSGVRKDMKLGTAKKIAKVLGVTLEKLCEVDEQC